MKLHDLRPAAGSHQLRTRVGRGIAAGKGKTAGRGTKGQKARAGGSIPPWFEGGQTPLHMRIPKLRGFKNRFKVEFEVVNLGAIARLVELGALEAGQPVKGSRAATAPITVNQDILRAVGLVRTLNKPLKILGGGEVSTPLFVVADAFSRTAVGKIEAAGGSVSVLEIPTESRPALRLDASAVAAAQPRPSAAEPSTPEPAAPEPPTPAETPASPAGQAATPKRTRTTAARQPVDTEATGAGGVMETAEGPAAGGPATESLGETPAPAVAAQELPEAPSRGRRRAARQAATPAAAGDAEAAGAVPEAPVADADAPAAPESADAAAPGGPSQGDA